MRSARGALWGPSPLPEFLTEQLRAHGFEPGDAGVCARQIAENSGEAAVASLFVDLGGCKLLEGDVDGAIAAWRHAISSQHAAAASRALLNLGLLYEHLHLHSAALGVFSTVADRNVDPYVAPAAMASARCQMARGEAEHAMETMARLAQHTMSIEPDSAELIETLYGLGEVAEEAGRLDRAERSWRVASLSPPSELQEEATKRLIQLLLNQGHDDELIELFERQPVDRRASSGSALVDRAETLARLGHRSQAAALAAAIAGPGLATKDRFRLAEVRVQTGDVNAAIDVLEPLLTNNEDQVRHRAAHTLGEIYQSYDMVDAAALMFEQVAEGQDPYWSPKGALSLGDLRETKGDSVAARGYWTAAALSAHGPTKTVAEARLKGAHTGAGSAAEAVSELGAPDAEAVVVDVVDAGAAEDGGVEPQVVLLDESANRQFVDALPVDLIVPEVVSLGVDAADTPEPAAPAVLAPAAEPQVVALDSIVRAPDTPEIVAAATADAIQNGTIGRDAEPDIVVLASLDDSEPNASSDEATESASAFASHLRPSAPAALENPYAALAPDGEAGDITPSTRNPYAELAPNYDDREPPPDVRTGDWESILEDWPDDEPENSGSSAFSRYT